MWCSQADDDLLTIDKHISDTWRYHCPWSLCRYRPFMNYSFIELNQLLMKFLSACRSHSYLGNQEVWSYCIVPQRSTYSTDYMCTITHQLCLIHPSSTVYSSLAPAQRQTLSPLYSSNLTWRSSQSLCTGDLRTRLKKQFSMWKEGRQSKIRQTDALSEAEHEYSFNEKAPLVTTIIPQQTLLVCRGIFLPLW